MAQQAKEWLIKLNGHNVFACRKNGGNTTKSAKSADRFFTKEDAEVIIRYRKLGDSYSAVHISEIQEDSNQ